MNDQDKTNCELISELQELREQNNSLNSLCDQYKVRNQNPDVSLLEKRLALVLQGGKMAWWEMDVTTGGVTFDKLKVEMLGYDPENFKHYRDFTRLVHPDDYQKIMNAMRGHFQGVLANYETEYRILTQSGEYIWFYDYGYVVKRDSNGRPLICTGFVYNISERKHAEELLQKSEQMFQAILDNFPGVVFWKDMQSNYLGCNQNFLIGAGLKSQAEIVGVTDFNLPWGLTEGENYRTDDLNVMESGTAKMHIVENQHQIDGHVIWFDTSKIPLRDSQGKVIGVIGVSNDITMLKMAEHQLINANKELTVQIEERVKRAAELIIALEKAEESDQLKSAFLANMSHEIRTPMNGILGFVDLLKEPDITKEEQKEFLGVIENSIARMFNIINDIVDFSIIESGQMKISISNTNVNSQIESIYTFFRPKATQKGLQIFFKNALPSNEAILKTDSDKLFAILTNLVKNAIKYTPSGFIEFGYVKKENHLEFFVKDTGIGITDEQKEIIFDRFRQGSESSSRKYQGAGLGLSITKAYVELLGGTLWVESDFQKGSVFYFTLPYNMEVNENGKNGKK